MKQPIIIERFADNGEHSHYELIDTESGEILWSEELIYNPLYTNKEVCDFVEWVDGFTTQIAKGEWANPSEKAEFCLTTKELFEQFKKK